MSSRILKQTDIPFCVICGATLLAGEYFISKFLLNFSIAVVSILAKACLLSSFIILILGINKFGSSWTLISLNSNCVLEVFFNCVIILSISKGLLIAWTGMLSDFSVTVILLYILSLLLIVETFNTIGSPSFIIIFAFK